MSSSILFVAHGSPAPGYAVEVQGFVQTWQRLHEGVTVRLGYLESLTPAFAQVLLEVVAAETVVVPLFLHEGWHMQQDVAAAVAASGKGIAMLPPLTSESFLLEALLGRLDEAGYDGGALVLYSHGSRHDTGHRLLVSLAAAIGQARQAECRIAVARGTPALQDELSRLAQDGERRVTVLPHFLFGGLWQKKLQQRVETAAVHGMDVRVTARLGAHPAMLAMVDAHIAAMEESDA